MPENDNTSKKPFLAYLPAILTGMAALITAISGFLAIYYNYIAPVSPQPPLPKLPHAIRQLNPPPAQITPAAPAVPNNPPVAEPTPRKVEVSRQSEQAVLTTHNTAVPVGGERWDWSIYIDADAATLDTVSCVEYTLHRTFPNPVRTICTRNNGFRLGTNGWGTFKVKLRVLFKDGSEQRLEHQLVFRR